jgi:hypothetical protein
MAKALVPDEDVIEDTVRSNDGRLLKSRSSATRTPPSAPRACGFRRVAEPPDGPNRVSLGLMENEKTEPHQPRRQAVT